MILILNTDNISTKKNLPLLYITEQNHENWKQAFDILRLGLDSKAIRLSIDLWIAYLELYHKMYI